MNARTVAKVLLDRRYGAVNVMCGGPDLSKFAVEDYVGAEL